MSTWNEKLWANKTNIARVQGLRITPNETNLETTSIKIKNGSLGSRVKGLGFIAYPSSSSVDRTMASPGGIFGEVLGNREAKEDGEANNEDVACHVHVCKLKLWNPSSHCWHNTHNTIIKLLQLPTSLTSRSIHKHWLHIDIHIKTMVVPPNRRLAVLIFMFLYFTLARPI